MCVHVCVTVCVHAFVCDIKVWEAACALCHHGHADVDHFHPDLLSQLGGLQRHLLLHRVQWLLQLCCRLCAWYVYDTNGYISEPLTNGYIPEP